MHRARALANYYYWNKYYRAKDIDKRFTMYLPREDALRIINEEEYEMLLALSE